MTLPSRSRRSLCGGWKRFKGAFLPLSPVSPLPNAADRIFGISGGAHAPNWFKAGGDEDQDDVKFNILVTVQ